jgi:hypothetical protein
LKEFNKDVFKKTVSPFKKWAYVEGIACFLKGADTLFFWLSEPLLSLKEDQTDMMADNEDGEGVKNIAAMFGLMVLTAYSALSEHSLFKLDSEIKNIGIMSLLMLEFARGDGQDLDIGWGCEIVRLCDEAGIDLDKQVRKQVSLSTNDLKEMRAAYKKKKNGYKAAAETKGWKPENDIGGEWDDKQWFRWDWKLEVRSCSMVDSGGADDLHSIRSSRRITKEEITMI